MSAEENAALIRRAFAAFNSRDLAGLLATVAPDFTLRTAVPERPMDAAALRELFTRVWAAFPDGQITLEEVVADRDIVATRETWRGTHQGDFRGLAPSGRPFTLTRMHFFRLRDGLITDEWAEGDIRHKLGAGAAVS